MAAQAEGAPPSTRPDDDLLSHYGAALIAEASAALAAPPSVAPAASTLFHRFYARTAFADVPPAAGAAAALFVALKVEEAAGPATPRRLLQAMARRVARWRAEAAGGGGGGAPPPPPLELYSRPYEAAKAELVANERRLMVALGFKLRVEAPHGLALQTAAHALGGAEGGGRSDAAAALPPGALASDAWALCNASLRTRACLVHGAPAIACGAVWLAGRRLGVPLPGDGGQRGGCRAGWWELHGVGEAEVREVAARIAAVLAAPKPLAAALWAPPPGKGAQAGVAAPHPPPPPPPPRSQPPSAAAAAAVAAARAAAARYAARPASPPREHHSDDGHHHHHHRHHHRRRSRSRSRSRDRGRRGDECDDDGRRHRSDRRRSPTPDRHRHHRR